MISNANKNSSRETVFNEKRSSVQDRRKDPFPVWSRIHRIIHERPRFQGLDYSGLPRHSRS